MPAATETASPSAPAAETPSFDTRFAPVAVEVLRVGEPGDLQFRTLDVRARNVAAKPVHEVKLTLTYANQRGLRLGRWTTVHTAEGALIGGRATNEFALQAFFVPQFTHDVHIDVEAVGFTDGTRWPEVSLPPETRTPRP